MGPSGSSGTGERIAESGRPATRFVARSDGRAVGMLGEAAGEPVERRNGAHGARGVLEHGAADRFVLADDLRRSHDREHERALRSAGMGGFYRAADRLDHAVGPPPHK